MGGCTSARHAPSRSGHRRLGAMAMESTTDTLTEHDDIDDTAVSRSGWSMSAMPSSGFSDTGPALPSGAIAIGRAPAGSGKTSFRRSLGGRMPPSEGQGRLGDLDVRKQAPAV